MPRRLFKGLEGIKTRFHRSIFESVSFGLRSGAAKASPVRSAGDPLG